MFREPRHRLLARPADHPRRETRLRLRSARQRDRPRRAATDQGDGPLRARGMRRPRAERHRLHDGGPPLQPVLPLYPRRARAAARGRAAAGARHSGAAGTATAQLVGRPRDRHWRVIAHGVDRPRGRRPGRERPAVARRRSGSGHLRARRRPVRGGRRVRVHLHDRWTPAPRPGISLPAQPAGGPGRRNGAARAAHADRRGR